MIRWTESRSLIVNLGWHTSGISHEKKLNSVLLKPLLKQDLGVFSDTEEPNPPNIWHVKNRHMQNFASPYGSKTADLIAKTSKKRGSHRRINNYSRSFRTQSSSHGLKEVTMQ